MASRRSNPKKNKAARRRRPDLAGLPRARFSLDDLAPLLSAGSPEQLPLMALPSVWLWNAAEDGHAAAHCIEACLTVHFALAEYGIESDVQAVGVTIIGDGPDDVYGISPRFNSDGTFNGHTILVIPSAGRLIDPTIQQFPGVPRTVLATLPVLGGLPAGRSLGEDVFAVVRKEYTIGYWPLREPERYAWRGPVVEAHLDDFRAAGGELAANTFDMLRMPHVRDRIAQSPYPRLRALLSALDGWPSVVEDGRYLFADPATGQPRSLADMP
jgi:hypothetical protein